MRTASQNAIMLFTMLTKHRMSVGFADLTHYTRMVELLGSEQGLEVLHEAFGAAGDAIVRHGGRIRKYIGDAILFTFDDPQRAARAAAEIAGGFRRSIGPLLLRYRVGIATGDVLEGEIGHPSLRVQDIMGQTVNQAARLIKEAGKSDSGVALCEQTQQLLNKGL
jgi:adenylate cyclase